MADARTIHASAVDALLDQLTVALSMTRVLESALVRQGDHDAVLSAVRALHTPTGRICEECNVWSPCPTALLLSPD